MFSFDPFVSDLENIIFSKNAAMLTVLLVAHSGKSSIGIEEISRHSFGKV